MRNLFGLPAAVALLVATAVPGMAQEVRRTAAPLASSRATYAVATPGKLAAVVPGTLILRGGAPRQGQLYLAERWMVFRPDGAPDVIPVPVIVTYADGRPPVWAMRVVASRSGEADTAFDIRGWGRFLTAQPKAISLLLGGRSAPDLVSEKPGALLRSGVPAHAVIEVLAASGFADTLYSIAGPPRAPIGLLSEAHRRAGDAALYSPATDSIALDPHTARSFEDLRGMLAHEIGHRLQRTRPALLEGVWTTVPAITDPDVYGFGNREEHQAEAFRFAVVYLQITASKGRDRAADVMLLDLYESLMPGTRAVARLLLGEPVFSRHPLRDRLRKAD